MSNNENQLLIQVYIPDLYSDRRIEDGKNIFNSFNDGIYRFYRIVLAFKPIGYIQYHITFDNPLFTVDKIEIDYAFRNKKYGTLLLNESLKDVMKDFPYLEKVNVCSSPNAINFYRQSQFESYLGENNLIRNLRKLP